MAETTRTLRRAWSDGDFRQHQDPIYRPSLLPIPQPTSDNASNRESSSSIPPLFAGAIPPPTPQTTLQLQNSADDDQDSPNSPNPPHHGSWYNRWMAYVGIGRRASRERRSLVALLLNLTSGSVQIVVITVILSLSGTTFKSPLNRNLTEWAACSRPLGVWASIWVARALLACSLNYWGFVRERKIRARHLNARDSNSDTVNLASPGRTAGNAPRIYGVESSEANIETGSSALPHTLLYSRLTLFSSLLTLSWFLTAHILEYSSINTCRHTSPHLWWLTFGILCLMYLMVLEVVVLGFIVFIIAPILFNTNVIKPEIIYAEKPTVLGSAYPPKNTSPASKSRFKFIRSLPNFQSKKATKRANDKDTEKGLGQPQKWEDHWEQSDYPFVVLEGNRAACAICLMDFEEPKRLVGADNETKSSEPVDSSKPAESPNDSTTNSDIELKLADAGEGSQPLRLLACGHVYHKTCLDPWLIDVSGRCPVCQRPVETPAEKKSKKGRPN